MTLDTLKMRYFATIASLGSMTLAARELRVAQSALSVHMRSLEELMGTQLLNRTSRGITLTEAGETLYAHVQSILRAIEQAEHATREQGAHPSGHVVLGVITSVCSTLGVEVLQQCQQRFPRISLSVVEGNSYTLREALDSHAHDLSVTLSNVAKASSDILFEEPLVVVGPPGHFEENGKEKDLTEVLRLPLILTPQRHGTRMSLETLAHGLGITLNIAWIIEGLSATKAAVRSGMGFSILAQSAVHDEIADGSLSFARIPGDVMTRHVVVDIADNHPPTRATLEVLKLVKQIARKRRESGLWTKSITR